MNPALTIDRLGARGDGVAETPEGPVYVPFTLPGETVTASVVRDRGDLISVTAASAHRIDPVCRHFGACGGCALQHMEAASYREWKRGKVAQLVRSLDPAIAIDPVAPCAPGSRRRVTLAARKTIDGVVLGYNQALSHHIVPIAECPIATPRIVAALDDLRQLAGLISATPDAFRLTVTDTVSGLDVAADGCGRLSDKARLAASDHAIKKGFARLSVDGEIVVEPKRPLVDFGGIAVALPPGGFLQAVAAAEAIMAEAVLGHLRRARRVADLFCGSGAFALRLAATSEIHAVEGEALPLAELDRAVRFTKGLKPVTTERRDLFRRPMTAKELDRFDGLVFDPPRAGAREQCEQIAKSSVPVVAAVSCNPATLARDLAILIDGGYRIESVTPVDQFLWSAHVEAVALLRKPKKRR